MKILPQCGVSWEIIHATRKFLQVQKWPPARSEDNGTPSFGMKSPLRQWNFESSALPQLSPYCSRRHNIEILKTLPGQCKKITKWPQRYLKDFDLTPKTLNFIDKRKVFELFIIMHKMTLNSIALGHVVEYDLCTCHNEAMLAYAIIKKISVKTISQAKFFQHGFFTFRNQ